MRLCIAVLFPLLASAQQDVIAFGATLFRTNCAVPYCHGAAGAAGRAPALAGRSFAGDRLVRVIREGIPKSGMPAFKGEMADDWIDAIAVYLNSLSGPASPASPAPPARVLPPAAKAGRAIFFDSTRMGGCGTCHAADGWGVPIGSNLTQRIPTDVAALRASRSTHLKLAQPQNETSFPALPIATAGPIVTLYDLSSPLPVLRSFAAGKVRLSSDADWNHASTLRSFSDAELESILQFLRAAR